MKKFKCFHKIKILIGVGQIETTTLKTFSNSCSRNPLSAYSLSYSIVEDSSRVEPGKNRQAINY
jgi:hypothetical protein